MKKNANSVLFAAFILSAVSCKKSQSGSQDPAATLAGNYKFVNIQIDAFSTVGDDILGGSSQDLWTFADFTTTNNSGDLAIGESKMSTTDLTYGVSTIFPGIKLINDIFADSIYTPYGVTVSPASNTFSYKLVSRDSIYFPSGFVNPPGAGWPVQTIGYGATYSLISGRLIIEIVIPWSESIETNGNDTHSSGARVTETITFLKQ